MNTHISTTITPTTTPSTNSTKANPDDAQDAANQTDQTTTNPDTIPSTTTSPDTTTFPPLETSSLLISPETGGCVVLSREAIQRYSKQIKAQSYRTKPLPITLTPVPTRLVTQDGQGGCEGEGAMGDVVQNNTLVQDFSLILASSRQKHIEKKAARLSWLQERINSGKLTEEEMKEMLRRDGLKDSSIESTFAETDTTSSGNNIQFVPTRTTDYVLTVPTYTYKRANAYALIFRSFSKHTPLPNSPLTQTQEQGGEEAGDADGEGTVAKAQRKQYIEKQQRANKAVPTVSIDLESMSESQLSEFEKKHVHSVYDNIADHFSGTRYQAWPQVDEFVQGLPEGTMMADIGCGNGKYLSVNPKITTIGCDISFNLLKLAHDRGCEVAVGDSLAVPLRSNAFDNTISIAVLHHIASRTRRIKAINEMLRVTRPGGKVLITVWAKEQDGSGGRVFNQGDVWVPFKTLSGSAAEIQRQKEKRAKEKEEWKKTHVKVVLAKGGEEGNGVVADDDGQVASTDAFAATATIIETNDNKTTSTATTTTIDAQLPEDVSEESTRFYHVFCQGEMEDHVNDPAIAYPMSIDRVFYGKGNWCIIMTRLEGERKMEGQ